jgi:hypothetical protein
VVTRRQVLLVVALVCYALAVIAARPASTPGPFVRDFEAYWSAGRIASQGGDPYGRDVWRAERTVPGVAATRDELLPFVGPPYTLWVWRAFGSLDFTAAARFWWALLAAAIAGLAIVSLMASGLTPRWPPVVGALLFAFSFGPITSGLSLGQVTAVAMLGACVAAVWSRRARAAKVAIASVAAALQPNVAIGTLALLRSPRSAIGLASGAIVAYLAGAAARGWNWPFEYVRLLNEHARAELFAGIQIVPSAILYGVGVPPAAAIGCGIAIALLAIAAAAYAMFAIRDPYVCFACISALIPFATGFVHEHDLIVALPAAMLTAARSRGLVRAVALIGTLFVAIDWLGLAQRPTGIVQGVLLAIVAGCMFAAFGPGGIAEAAAAFVVCIVFAGSAWVAAMHPLAVWPDALDAFRAPAGADAAAVWHAELVRNGLFVVNPAAAFLRALSLIGCALLAAAVWRERDSLDVDVHHVVERRPRVGLETG